MKAIVLTLLTLFVSQTALASNNEFVCSGLVNRSSVQKKLEKRFIRFKQKLDIASADLYQFDSLKISLLREVPQNNHGLLTLMAADKKTQTNTISKGSDKGLVLLAVTKGETTYSIGCTPYQGKASQ